MKYILLLSSLVLIPNILLGAGIIPKPASKKFEKTHYPAYVEAPSVTVSINGKDTLLSPGYKNHIRSYMQKEEGLNHFHIKKIAIDLTTSTKKDIEPKLDVTVDDANFNSYFSPSAKRKSLLEAINSTSLVARHNLAAISVAIKTR